MATSSFSKQFVVQDEKAADALIAAAKAAQERPAFRSAFTFADKSRLVKKAGK